MDNELESEKRMKDLARKMKAEAKERDKGWDERIRKERLKSAKLKALTNIFVGAVLSGGGLLITFFTGELAAASAGAIAIIPCGAIIFGGAQLLLGIHQLLKASRGSYLEGE